MFKTLTNYCCKLVLLLAAIYAINFTHKMVYCALLFTTLVTILNGIAKCHGSKKASISILLCTTTSLGLLYNKPYCMMGGKPISGLIVASLSAILVAAYIGSKVFVKLYNCYGFATSNYISLLVTSLVDHFIMGLFFTTIFPFHKIGLMVYQETIYTHIFASIVYVCSIAVLYAKPFYLKLKQHIALLTSRRPVRAISPSSILMDRSLKIKR